MFTLAEERGEPKPAGIQRYSAPQVTAPSDTIECGVSPTSLLSAPSRPQESSGEWYDEAWMCLRPLRVPAVVVPLLVSACVGQVPSHVDTVAYYMAGHDSVHEKDSLALSLAAVADQASRDFGCPAGTVQAQERVSREVYSTQGCGKRGIYVRVARRGQQVSPLFATGVWIAVTRFVLISRDGPLTVIDEVTPAHQENKVADYVIAGRVALDADQARTTLRDVVTLSAQAARDLACPREEVVIDFRSLPKEQGVTAEGCGKRATYTYGRAGADTFNLMSVVPLSRSDDQA